MREDTGHTVDRTLIVVLIALLTVAIVLGTVEHFTNRAAIKTGVVSSIRASCKQADALLQSALRSQQEPLSPARRAAMNLFIKDYYSPLNEALEGLNAPQCRVPHV